MVRLVSAAVFGMVLVVAGTSAHAGSASGAVQDYTYSLNNDVNVRVAGTEVNPPSCNTTGTFTFRGNSNLGKALLQSVINSQQYGLVPTIYGTGSCPVNTNAEAVASILVAGTPNLPAGPQGPPGPQGPAGPVLRGELHEDGNQNFSCDAGYHLVGFQYTGCQCSNNADWYECQAN